MSYMRTETEKRAIVFQLDGSCVSIGITTRIDPCTLRETNIRIEWSALWPPASATPQQLKDFANTLREAAEILSYHQDRAKELEAKTHDIKPKLDPF